MKLYNFLSRKVEEFKPSGKTAASNAADVGLYTCGPTVYDFVHIGNWRTFVFEDILKRVLAFNGYKVNHVMNITDIDDKVINRAKSEKTTIRNLTRKYTDAFFGDLEKLNIIKADKYPIATDHINSMIRIIELLVKGGFAYVRDGSVYFSIAKFKGYGKLSGANIKGVKAGARVDVDEYDKDNPQDFALWKKESEDAKKRHEAFDSPWGVGRPGWHIECSAMSMQYLGESFDIHTGGVDLLFPHHENEIAQSEGATGKKFVNFWCEGEHLLVEGEKMAKRLGNIFTLKDVIEKGFDPVALRYLFLTAHYRSQLNFTWKSLEAAQNALNNLRGEVENWDTPKVGCAEFEGNFKEAINNDLDMPKASSVLWEMVKSDYPTSARHRSILSMDKVLGLGLDQVKGAELPKGAKELIARREQLRAEGDYEASDKMRKELKSIGVEVEDTSEGPKWKVKRGSR
ncbi:cysteine--tRNA ligase [Candidatus Curtissbacteria bacterium RIFCSPLOWO2_01_FULL_42_26]|uniref:Cysteine--tRNA ligase n=1 Tax=Candidatus Curtissbacteria bacterium RIFCSPLOWO2_01_FULL_42_26 TaxID=1797729 RepID=A0A1F5I219_9BACT|nr:MAG: cysteine--tRNA ligase [Candidatus Curtissbacteria bacterium RIFCSPLOWO2_01_FULL_42_26]